MENMSVATKQKQQDQQRQRAVVRSPRHDTNQQHGSNKTNYKLQRQQQLQWNGGKSVATPIGQGNKPISTPTPTPTPLDIHEIKKYKSLTKQTPVGVSIDSGDEQDTKDKRQRVKALTKEENIAYNEELESYSDIYETPPDYRIYQEAKLQDFFKDTIPGGGKPQRAKTISDVCLVNDHYILVKMPENKPEVVKAETKNYSQVRFCQSVDDNQRTKRKMYHCLGRQGNRIRKIAPISEEPEYLEPSSTKEEPPKSQTSKSRHCLSVNTCWQAPEEEMEIYQTRTKIQKPPTQQPVTIVREVHKCAHKFTQTTETKPLAPNGNKSQEVQSISGSIIASSQHDRVSLQSNGSLIVVTANNNANLDIGACRKSCTPKRRKCLRFERFHWLLRPFRGKYRKTKPKIQAVVYKTYFVKWTKPPETQHHGYGSAKLTEVGSSLLRRCRSAIF